MSSPPEFATGALEAARRRVGNGDNKGACVLFEEALAHAPGNVQILVELAECRLAHQPLAAIDLAKQVVALEPNHVWGWNLLGRAASSAGRRTQALAAFARAADLAPHDNGGWANLAVAQIRAGDPLAAIGSAGRAIEIEPNNVQGHASLGHALNVLRRSHEAHEAFVRALSCKPDDIDSLRGMAKALVDMGRPSWAVLALLRAQAIDPDCASCVTDLSAAFVEVGDLVSAQSVRQRAQARAYNLRRGSNALMSMQYDPAIDEEHATREAQDWGRRVMAAARPITSAAGKQDLPDGRKLKIGYVSGDFYRHPVGFMGAGPIMAHDRDRVHVTLYANQTAEDELTRKIRGAVDCWVPVLGMDDDQLAAKIASDEIDVLIDLCGHTASHRLEAFARKPARVQASWLGYFATTGLSTIDYVVLDDQHVLAATQAHFVESIVQIPGCRFTYLPPDYAPAPSPPPVVSTGRITFGSFNRGAKINQHVIDLWSDILKQVPRSDLLLKWSSFSDAIVQLRIKDAFKANGIDPARIRFSGHSPHKDMLAQYGEIDIALDPFPFCGGMTSCEALWMGVPVVTLPGNRVVSRQTHSILMAIGHGELSAATLEDYAGIAVELANSIEKLSTLRQNLRKDLAQSCLFDFKGFSRNLEEMYFAWFKSTNYK